jgi:hypothetical protein
MIYVYADEAAALPVFSVDAELDEGRECPADATTYPVDSGFTMSDGVAIGCEKFKFSGIVTCTPISPLPGIPWTSAVGAARLQAALDALLKVRNAGQPVVLCLRYWSPTVLLTNIRAKTGLDSGAALEVDVEAVEVRRATPAYGSIPASKLSPKVKAQAAKPGDGGAAGKKSKSSDLLKLSGRDTGVVEAEGIGGALSGFGGL